MDLLLAQPLPLHKQFPVQGNIFSQAAFWGPEVTVHLLAGNVARGVGCFVYFRLPFGLRLSKPMPSKAGTTQLDPRKCVKAASLGRAGRHILPEVGQK